MKAKKKKKRGSHEGRKNIKKLKNKKIKRKKTNTDQTQERKSHEEKMVE